MSDQKRITIPGRYDQIGAICAFVADGADQAGLDDSSVFGVQLACDEACTNIIEHAYGREDAGEIDISWRISDDALTITIRDHGRPFDLDKIPPPQKPTGPDDATDLKVGGLGVHFIRQMMDEITFTSNAKEGNTLIMVKKIKKGGQP
jgi:serine/threonine-protein kinase RsbW